MASIYGETGKNGFRLRLDYEVTGQSISDNTSTVHMVLYLYANTTGTYNNDGDAYWTIYRVRTYYTFSYTSVGWYKLGERTVTIGHDAKGEKTVTLSGEWCSAISGGWAPYSLSVSGSVTLPTIPRKAEITSAPDFTDVDDPTVYYNNPAGTAASSVEICISLTGAKDDVPYRAMDRSGGSYTFNLTDGERATLRNATVNSRTVSFMVRTVLGGTTYYASATKTFTVTSNSATIPAESIALSPESALAAPFSSLYIQRKTKVSIKHTASGRFGASIQQYRAAVDGKTYDGQSAESDYLKTAGDLTVTGTATDSRGFSGSSQQTITVLPYALPAVVPRSRLGAIVCGRSLSDGTLDSNGTRLLLRCARKYSSVNGNNKCTLRLRYKPEGGSYSGWVTLLAESDSGDDYDGVVAGVTLPVSTAYTIEVQAADKLGEAGTAQMRIPTAEMTLHLGEGGTSAAFGRYAVEGSEKRLDVAWNAYFEKGLQVGGNLTADGELRCTWVKTTDITDLGNTADKVAVINQENWIYYRTMSELLKDMGINDYIVAQGTSGIWTYRKWAGGVAECWAKITQTVTPGDAWAGTLNLAPYVITVTTPIEFTAIDCVNASAYVGSGHTITSSVSATTPNKISIPALSLYLTGQQECRAYVHVMGRWK